jgi:phosphoglycerate dehydrogenase-like enzyme
LYGYGGTFGGGIGTPDAPGAPPPMEVRLATTATVLLSPAVAAAHRTRLTEAFPDVDFVAVGDDGGVPTQGRTATGLLRVALGKPALSRALGEAPSVRWVHTSTAGFDWALVPEIVDQGIVLTRSAASYALPIGEFVLALIAAHAKRFGPLAEAQRAKRWASVEPLELAELTVGVVGAGGIGREVAWRCRALGMRVVATQRTPRPQPEFDAVWPAAGLHDLLAASDVVVVACPLTPETRGLIDAAALRAMRPDAYLINVARGAIVDTAALLDALREGRLAGAALDAFEEEPLPADHPLWSAPGVVVTPHTSFKSPRNLDRVIDEFADNLRRFLADEPLRHRLRDAALGY